MADDTLIYFISYSNQRFVKIGTTRDLRARLAGLQTSHPHDLKVLGTIPGGQVEECEWHRKFAHLRARGEWFRLKNDLRRAIDAATGSRLDRYSDLPDVTEDEVRQCMIRAERFTARAS